MKRTIIVLSSILLMAAFTSCEKVVGEGPVQQQLIPVSGFNKLSVGISGTVNYTIGADYRVEVRAQQNIIEAMRFNREGEELVISFRPGVRVKATENIIVNITAPTARSVNLSGSASVRVNGPLAVDNLDLRISGSGQLEVQQADITSKLSSWVSGSGTVSVLNGSAQSTSLHVSGSGNLNVRAVQAAQALAEVSGSGNIRLHASQTLDAHISGSGNVYYLGSPVISSHISGSGGVRPL